MALRAGGAPFRSACSATAPSASAFAELLDERADEIERFNGRRPVISGRAHAQRGATSRRSSPDADLLVELMGGIEPAREYLLRGDARRQGRRQRQQAAALPARRGAVRDRPRARRAAALRGRGGRRGAGRAGARGVAVGDADRAHPRDRQRHDQLHPHRDDPRQRPTRRRSPRRSASATPRPTPATTSAAATRPRRWRSSRAWRSARRCTSTTCRYEGIEHLQATTSSTRASSVSG